MRFKHTLYILSGTIFLLISCRKNNDTTPEIPCKLTKFESASPATPTIPSNSQITTQEYNDLGLPTNRSTRQNRVANNNTKEAISSSINFFYDADKFLTKKVSQISATYFDGTINTYSFTNDYIYINGRLVKDIEKEISTGNGKTITYITIQDYEYNNEGNIVKYTNSYITTGGTSATFTNLYEYRNGNLVKLTDNSSGTTSDKTIEVNRQGLITKSSSGTYENRYQYDIDGNQTSIEQWRNGKKKYVTVTEYDVKKSINSLEFYNYTFKGHPDVYKLSGSPNYSYATHNSTKISNYTGESETLESIQTYTYTYNTKGYPSSSEMTQTDGAGTIVGKETRINSFIDCQ